MLELLSKHKLTLILIVAALSLVIGGVFAYQRFLGKKTVAEEAVNEQDILFDPEGPYAMLFPRRDGNALVLNIKRTGSYDSIKYELSYNSEGIDRGANGEINAKEKKGEYEQEILFGSCSTGGTCVYDKDVENGTLIFHIRKGKEAYRMVTQWHLQKPDLELGKLTSADNHFSYEVASKSADLSLIKFTIVNDLSGAPKLPGGKVVLGKVYAINGPMTRAVFGGKVTIELAENPPAGSKIARFDELKNQWIEYETKASGSTLEAQAESGGIFAVLTSKN